MNKKTNLNPKFRILSIEAKQLYHEMKYGNHDYSIKDEEGNYKLKQFKGILDYSLDLIELGNVHKRKRTPFGFKSGRFDYLLDIINLKFNYSLHEFEPIGNVYYRKGYYKTELTDNISIKDGKLVAVKVGVECKDTIDQELYKDYFTFNPVSKKYEYKKSLKGVVSKSDIRNYLYENGFTLDGCHYVRYKRSAGSSREGHCLFIKEELYKPMMKWSMLGISEDKKNKDLVSFEAYNALSLSSIESTIELNPKNILILKDKEIELEEEVINVVSGENSTLKAVTERAKIKNSIWDGEGLLDESVFEELKKKDGRDRGMVLLRGRFFKNCAFNTKLSKWFENNGIKDIKDLNGYTEATSVSDIKLVVTESSIKYLKFGTISEWIDKVSDGLFGIVKSDKPTHYFDGEMVRANYQLLNTLEFTDNELKEFIKPTLDYKKLVNDKEEVLRYHIHFDKEHNDPDEISEKNDIVFALLGRNNLLPQTKLFKDFRALVSKSFRRRVLNGAICVNGTYATIFGNGYEMLLETVNKFDGKTSLLKGSDVMTTFFKDNEEIVGERSPHITMGNILYAKNTIKEEILDYFNLTKEIISINSIGNNIMQKLNGCDFDSDTMLITNNKYIVEAAKKNYKEYKVPNCAIKPNVQNKTLSEIDMLIQDNKIGEIVNLSQYLNSKLWDTKDKSIYDDICILAVLSGMEIDKAKRVYDVDVQKVLDSIKSRHEIKVDNGNKKVTKKPMFFNYVVQDLNSKKKYSYDYFNTTMDNIVKILNEKNADTKRGDTIPLFKLIDTSNMEKEGYHSKKAQETMNIIDECYNEILQHRSEYKSADEDRKSIIKDDICDAYSRYIDLLKNNLKHEYTVYLILKKLEEREYQKLLWTAIYLLYNDKYKMFVKIMTSGKEGIKFIEKTDKESDYKIYDYNFKIV